MKSPAFFVALNLMLCALQACQPSAKQNSPAAAPTTVAAPASLEAFADSLVRLDKFSLSTIGDAARYYQQLVPADSTLADSAAVLWLHQVGPVLDSVNNKLVNDTADYFELVYNEGKSAPEGQKRFQQSLAANHIKLQGDGEGGVYAALDYEWAVPVLRQKTSDVVDAYLALLQKEETKPALLDAGLAVDIIELIDRLATSETLLMAKLPQRFHDDVESKNKFYTSVLLLGSDNSPALDYNSFQLSTEFEKGYAYLSQKYPASAAAKRVREWQSVIAAKDPGKLEEWRSKYAL